MRAPTKARRAPRLRSQYPADSREQHVEYILVASFDVDRGPVMEDHFPGAISGDENMLAELMLPDQAHVRAEDWTIFFLHKDTSEEERLRDEWRAERLRRREERRRRREMRERGEEELDGETLDEEEDYESEEESDEDGAGTDAPPLIYVLNLVNTKQDNTVKRFRPSRSARRRLSRSCADPLSQRRRGQGHGRMYSPFISAHLQSQCPFAQRSFHKPSLIDRNSHFYC